MAFTTWLLVNSAVCVSANGRPSMRTQPLAVVPSRALAEEVVDEVIDRYAVPPASLMPAAVAAALHRASYAATPPRLAGKVSWVTNTKLGATGTKVTFTVFEVSAKNVQLWNTLGQVAVSLQPPTR